MIPYGGMSDSVTCAVPGLHCDHCVAAVEQELSAVAGVVSVDVDLETKLVVVTGEELDDAVLRAAIDEAATTRSPHERDCVGAARAHGARPRGDDCAACAARIERGLNQLDGVEASVNLATERASVAFDPESCPSTAVGAVEAAGYRARPRTRRDTRTSTPTTRSAGGSRSPPR